MSFAMLKSDMKNAWQRTITNMDLGTHVKSRTKARETVGPLKVDGSLKHDSKTICEELNKFFSSVFTREDTSSVSLPNLGGMHSGHYIETITITPRMIETAIYEHLEVNNLLSSDQHGFRTGHSCTTNLLEFMEEVTSATDTGSPYDVIYFDFSKALDKVPR